MKTNETLLEKRFYTYTVNTVGMTFIRTTEISKTVKLEQIY